MPARAMGARRSLIACVAALVSAAASLGTGASADPKLHRDLAIPGTLCLARTTEPAAGSHGIARWTAPCGRSVGVFSVPTRAGQAAWPGPFCGRPPNPDAIVSDTCDDWIAKYDYKKGHAAPGYGSDVPVDIAVARRPGGDVIVATGLSWGGADADVDWATVAFDNGGRRLWAARRGTTVSGIFTGMDFPMAIAASPDGSTVFVTGMHDFHLAGDYAGTMATVAYDATTGTERWVALFDGPAGANFLDIGVAVETSRDGDHVFVTGQSQTGPTPPTNVGFGQYPSDFVTISYDAGTGAPEWTSRFGVDGNAWRPVAVRSDPSGVNLYVYGERLSGIEVATVAYDAASGAERWVARYDSDEGQTAEELAVGDSGVFVSGTSFPPGATAVRSFAIGYDTSGNQLWRSRFPGGARFVSIGSHIALDRDERRVYLAATRSRIVSAALGAAPPDYAIAALDASTGTTEWSTRYDGAAGTGLSIDIVNDLALSPDGARLVVTGFGGIAAGWTRFGYDLQPPFLRLASGTAAATIVLDPKDGSVTSEARFSPLVPVAGGAFGYRLAFGANPPRSYALAGISPLGAVDSNIDFMCGSAFATCVPVDRNADDFAVIAYS